jgi:NADH dehydrogenase [ubiquinone] 1 alpha subcomplex assembly factor 5
MTTPPLIFDRARLMHRRMRVAPEATSHDFLLTRVADDFAERLSIVNRTFTAGLNVEAYHGVLGTRLRTLPNVLDLIDCEPVAALRVLCRQPALASGHDDLDVAVGSHDLAVSGLSLHLVNDLPGALIQLRRALKPDGLLLASLLGGQTLHELRQSWLIAETEISDGASPRVAPFADVRALGALLQRAGFALPVADTDTVTVTYTTPLHLMRELKMMGASNMLVERRRTPVTRALLQRACDIYQARFATPEGRITATFEIITLTAWVPHDSQPKPLKPGSATTRLADALNVAERKL